MATQSMVSKSQESEVHFLLRAVKRNIAFLTKQDLQILEHLANKGDYPDKTAILITTK